MKRFLVLIMASVFFASGMPPAKSRAAEEYVLSLNLPIPPIHNRWHFALKQWTEELNKRSSGRIRVEPYFAEALSKEADRLTEPVMREWIDIVTKTGLPGKAIEAKFCELETRYAKPWNQSHSTDIAGKK